MEVLFDIISWVCLVSGSFFCLTGGIGLLRFPDFFTRIHAASLTDTLGASLILVGLMFQAGWGLVFAKLLLILMFSLLAGTTASHAMAKASLKSGLKPLESDDAEKDGVPEGERPSQQ
ncbi:monovalent cation/H(+) antiporter subunit G [Desulfofustis glycolicus]|uniref:Multisubunit sodium/proton antiporter, MrpG subunit n=1 Tax=Desulfofustis glycolicus DSM 9705 TaxID=1121409 RepID=A0A1M5TIK0_9BACT|nr:monovalent cation/H(+) antiporter subunit G [Desulfofustis glycolicus]MCB2216430.1 monovalent cation/H(+) antiporter subunit G [Desulfobulbaceae bacterium]SHH50582.1 multisubunit sodium/proton antiporter, MrpG subunit [Desulfofustis glycolicus DSM 9705]